MKAGLSNVRPVGIGGESSSSSFTGGVGAAAPSAPEPIRPVLPRPVQAGRSSWRAAPSDGSASSWRQPQSQAIQPSPRRLAPIGGPPQDAQPSEAERAAQAIQESWDAGRQKRTSEADVAAGNSSLDLIGAVQDHLYGQDHSGAGAKASYASADFNSTAGGRSFGSGAGDPPALAQGSRTGANKSEQLVLSSASRPAWRGGGRHLETTPVSARESRAQKKMAAAKPFVAMPLSQRRAKKTRVQEEMGSTGEFWRAYQATAVEHQGPAWQEPLPQRSIRTREDLDKMHAKRALKLQRLIKTGQLRDAEKVATGGHLGDQFAGFEHDVKEEVNKEIQAMSVQRKGLIEARKILEKSVVVPKDEGNELGKTLAFMLRGGSQKPDEPAEAH